MKSQKGDKLSMHYGAPTRLPRSGAQRTLTLPDLLVADGRLADGKEFDSSRKRGQPFVFTGAHYSLRPLAVPCDMSCTIADADAPHPSPPPSPRRTVPPLVSAFVSSRSSRLKVGRGQVIKGWDMGLLDMVRPPSIHHEPQHVLTLEPLAVPGREAQ